MSASVSFYVAPPLVLASGADSVDTQAQCLVSDDTEVPFFPGVFRVRFVVVFAVLFAPRWLLAVFSERETVRPLWPL